MKIIHLPREGKALLITVKALREMPPDARRLALRWLTELVDTWEHEPPDAAPGPAKEPS